MIRQSHLHHVITGIHAIRVQVDCNDEIEGWTFANNCIDPEDLNLNNSRQEEITWQIEFGDQFGPIIEYDVGDSPRLSNFSG